MLNFRKMRQDFSSNILKEGKALYDKSRVVSAKIIKLDNDTIRFSSKILGSFENAYESERKCRKVTSVVLSALIALK